MKLFLASEAKHPESIEKLREFIGGFEGKSIAYIPTAANGEESYGAWKTESSTWKLVNTLGAKVTPVVLEDYKNESVIEKLKGKDVIWFAGGMPGYLMYWVRRCGLDKKIKELLDQGSVYVGSSAGSMVAGANLDVIEWYMGGTGDETETGASVIPTMKLVDFSIYPHYEDKMHSDIKKLWGKGTLYLLKNGEAIAVENKKVTVLGSERKIVK